MTHPNDPSPPAMRAAREFQPDACEGVHRALGKLLDDFADVEARKFLALFEALPAYRYDYEKRDLVRDENGAMRIACDVRGIFGHAVCRRRDDK